MVTSKSQLLTLIVSLTLVIIAFTHQTTGTTTGQTSSSKGSTPSASATTQTPSSTKKPAGSSTTQTPTTLSPKDECPKHNSSCDECIKAADYKCFYCYGDSGNECLEYPVGDILPNKKCALSKARWGVCWVNFEALIITMSVIGGLILLTITVCCIKCCCCRGGDNKKYMKEEAKWERQKAERKQRSDDRKADRKQRMDEIRRKYGLQKE